MLYIVWNKNKTEGFVTKDKQIAYEARKSAITNCHNEDGSPSLLAKYFCIIYSEMNDCTIQEIENEDAPF